MKRLALAAPLLVACGSATPPPKVVEEAPPKEMRREVPVPVVQQELGSIDERGVEQTFQKLQGALGTCHTQGRDRLEVMAGDVKVFLRIDASGKVRYGYFEESSLGDRETERCILDVFGKASWPKPIGGEAEVRHAFGWEAGQERAPIAWSADKVTSAIEGEPDVKKELAACKAKGDLRLTAYVVEDDAPPPGKKPVPPEPPKGKKPAAKAPPKPRPMPEKERVPGGKFRAIGVAAPSREASEQVDCVIDALKKLPLPSPGSYAAKVSFRL